MELIKKPQWRPDSWQRKPIQQKITYPCVDQLNQVLQELRLNPPLVSHLEIEACRQHLASAGRGEKFILQGGDCAETFAYCDAERISNQLKILLQMKLLLMHGLQKPVITIGRIAGQYAKPRSELTQVIHNQVMLNYRGDLINSAEANLQARTPDPQRMLKGYSCSAYTLNYLRSLIDGGFADLHHPEHWDLSFSRHSKHYQRYQHIVSQMLSSLRLLETAGVYDMRLLRHPDFFISHECLHLPYEQALTRKVEGHWYNLATHFPWIGMRTNHVNGAHIEYARGIRNPIAVKIGPEDSPQKLKQLILKLNPDNQPGRICVIHRYGVQHIQACLAAALKAFSSRLYNIVWLCDPMHGNTKRTSQQGKTRYYQDIAQELEFAFQLHQRYQSTLAGVHFELTGENVTECVGGASNLTEADLGIAYESLVDPRLNYEQALEIALFISSLTQAKVMRLA